MKALANDELVFTGGGETISVSYKQYLRDEEGQKRGAKPFSVIDGIYTQHGTGDLAQLFDNQQTFQFPKPVMLMKKIISMATEAQTGDLILDFFAGSCPMAQAVLELNREDEGNRRFILIQLPEPTGRKDFPTIADIGKERIRRVIARLKGEGNAQPSLDQVHGAEDLGCKVLKLAPSHFKPWVGVKQLTPAQYTDQMALYNDPLVDGWTAEGVIQEIALKEGYGLGCRVEVLPEVISQTVYRLTDSDREQAFAICLDDQITLDGLKPLQLAKDDLFVCRDRALDDEAAANLALQCRLKTI